MEPLVLYSKHCKVDDNDDCSGIWRFYGEAKSYDINMECGKTYQTSNF